MRTINTVEMTPHQTILPPKCPLQNAFFRQKQAITFLISKTENINLFYQKKKKKNQDKCFFWYKLFKKVEDGIYDSKKTSGYF